ncbi:MAG: hypothetical protein F4Z18_04455 [Caldilineaceae bacterium SB0666_bin_21]|nr:hypothetical protein [Caldilineaceae bacterium SB0666_bin_21]
MALLPERLLTDFTVSQATRTGERVAVPELLDGLRERGCCLCMLGDDRGYDTKDCVRDERARQVTPHMARKKQHSALDRRTTCHAGYLVATAYNLVRLAKLLSEQETMPAPGFRAHRTT